jgi:DNA-binding MarR family transcriptional regulator
MSLKALTWAFDLQHDEMNSTMKLVLLTLANYANENGETYPKQNTIALKTLLTRQSVNGNLAKLEDLGIISMVRRKHEAGGFRSSKYQLMMPQAERVNDVDTEDGDENVVSISATRRVRQADTEGKAERQGMSPSTTRDVNEDDNLNRYLEPSPEPSSEPKPKPAKKRGPAALFPEDAFDQFWKLYPRKDGKKEARRIFDKISEAGEVEFSTIMEGLRLYVNKDDFRDWAWATTWLNQDRWDDRPKQKQRGAPSGRFKRVVAI